MVEGVGLEYGSFISEALIEPIKSVLIIDDDYPTLEEILSNATDSESSSKKWFKRPNEVLAVIKQFREKPSLIVDVNDASNLTDENGEVLAKHLHQSDLLILDYELDGDNGRKAGIIAQHVMQNGHFNLVVVHTESDIYRPFESILIPMLMVEEFNASSVQQGLETLRDLDENDDSGSDLFERVREAIGFQQYMHARHPNVGFEEAFRQVLKGDAPLAEFSEIIKEKGLAPKDSKNLLFWAFNEFQKNRLQYFSQEQQDVKWSPFDSSDIWIRSDRGFISFVNKAKGNEPLDLLEVLQRGLESWGPTPSRLLSAKLRATIEDKGGITEGSTLQDPLVQAKFYQSLYAPSTPEKSDDERRSLIDEQIGRQSEYLTNTIRDEVASYFGRIVDADIGRGASLSYSDLLGVPLFGDDEKALANKSFNSYVSLLPSVAGWHLSPGHIIRYESDYWVCLSPACDLVPGNRDKGIYKDVGSEKMPFLGVRLETSGVSLDHKAINSNNFLFLKEHRNDDQIKQLCFFSDTVNFVGVHWSIFVADENGKFQDDFNLRLRKFSSCPEFGLEVQTGRVVAQLRYEYALNLVQKLGSQLTRVGLGYLS